MDNFQLVVGSTECPNTVGLIIQPSTLISNKWSTLARGLNIGSEHIKKFRKDMLLDKITSVDVIWEVLELWVADNGSSATLGKLLNVLEGQCGANDVGESLRLYFRLPCKSADGNPSIDWKDISPAFQNRIVETFQKHFPTLKFSETLPNLKGPFLINLMTEEKPPLFVHPFPDTLRYYVNRTLITRNIISKKVFEQNSEDIFLFTGMNQSELSALAENSLTGTSSEQLRYSFTVKFMILDRDHHFETICDKTNHPVHLLRREDDWRLRWIRSKGRMDNLRKYVDQLQDEFDEEAFCRHLDSQAMPVLICDSPGMGKSVLLAQIGATLSQLYPDRTVLFIMFTEFIKLAKSIEIEDNIKMTEMALQKLIGEPVLHSHMSSEKTAFELLLDGFDEIDSADYKLAHEILKNVSISFKSIRLWVTSRPHLMEELETSLNRLGYNIRPFHEQDQVQFLSSFWSRKEQLDKERSDFFALNCLKSLKSKMDPHSQDIAGIPLQCLLIGEVYENDALEYARLDNENVPPTGIEIEIGTITNLFQRLIRKKIEKYKSSNDKLKEEDLMTIHARLSLELLFPDKMETLTMRPIPSDIAELLKVGIIVKSSGMKPLYAFMHRTVAEYFVAWFAVDKLRREGEWTEEFHYFFFRCILGYKEITDYFRLFNINLRSFKFEEPVICYFLNSFIADLRAGNNTAHICSQLGGESAELINGIAHASANDDLVHIFKLFHQCYEFDERYTSTTFTEDFLQLSIRHSSLELVKPTVNQLEQHNKFSMEVQAKALRTATTMGKFSIMEFLMKEKKLCGIVKDLCCGTERLVHDCIYNSDQCSDEQIQSKIQVLRLLIRINGSLLNNQVDERAPLFFYNVHVKLLIDLVRLGADVHAEYGKSTVLHFPRNLSSSDYQSFVMSIPDESLRKLVHKVGPLWSTPLKSALEYIDPAPETLDIYQRVGADFNYTIFSRLSLLELAIMKGRNAATIRKIIQHGEINVLEYKAKTVPNMQLLPPYQGTNLLHIAAEYGNVEAVGVLVDENGIDVNSKDEDGLTPLDIVIKGYNNSERFKTGWELKKRGGRFKDANSLLHIAATNVNVQSVRLLILLGVDVNRKDKQGNTALHKCLEAEAGYPDFTVVQLLLDGGADLTALNKMGKTPFHTALKNKNLDLNTFSLLKSKMDNTRSWTPFLCKLALNFALRRRDEDEALDENTFISILKEFCNTHQENACLIENDENFAVHVAASQGHHKGLQLLVEKGADINVKNKIGQTPLHVVACSKPEGYMNMIKYLIENGAYVYTKDNDHFTFLQLFILERPSPLEFHLMVVYLIETGLVKLFSILGGYNVTHYYMEMGDNSRILPLQLAVKMLEPEICTLELLQSNNVNFNAVDQMGHSILINALEGWRSLEFISTLINQFKVDWRVIDKQGWSILHHTAFCSNPIHVTSNYLKFFLELGGLNVNEVNDRGETPLFCTVINSSDTKNVLEKCKLLVAHGADVNIPNKEGLTPLAVVKRRYEGVVKDELVELLCTSLHPQQ